MELTPHRSCVAHAVVTSEASTLASQNAAGAGPRRSTPPSSFAGRRRSCQEGRPSVTERLLGHRRSVLALYEPLLAHVPSDQRCPRPAAPDGSVSQRLFTYLSETWPHRRRAALALGGWTTWAGRTSCPCRSWQSLSVEYLESNPLSSSVHTERGALRPAIARAFADADRRQSTLPRLDRESVRSMTGDMLALPEPPDDFVDYVMRKRGQPVLCRRIPSDCCRRTHSLSRRTIFVEAPGRKRPPCSEASQGLSLPRSLGELSNTDLRRFEPRAQQSGISPRRCSVANGYRSASACRSLLTRRYRRRRRARQAADPGAPEAGVVRFVHDKLPRSAYATTPRGAARGIATQRRQPPSSAVPRTADAHATARPWLHFPPPGFSGPLHAT